MVLGRLPGSTLCGNERLEPRRRQTLALQLLAHLLRGLAVHEGLGLRQTTGDGEVLLRLVAARGTHRQKKIERGARRALMQQLKEGVLGIVAGFAPDDGRGPALHRLPAEQHRLAVTFHLQLLQVRRKAPQ